MNKTKLLGMLNALLNTMKEVSESENTKLDIWSWVKETYYNKEKGHFCDSVACIMGHQVIASIHDSDNNPFAQLCKDILEDTPDVKDVKDDLGRVKRTLLGDVAIELTKILDKTCAEFLGSENLTLSIWDAYCTRRRNYARASELFTENEMDSFKHLTTDNPTAQDAADYIAACIQKVEEKFTINA